MLVRAKLANCSATMGNQEMNHARDQKNPLTLNGQLDNTAFPFGVFLKYFVPDKV